MGVIENTAFHINSAVFHNGKHVCAGFTVAQKPPTAKSFALALTGVIESTARLSEIGRSFLAFFILFLKPFKAKVGIAGILKGKKNNVASGNNLLREKVVIKTASVNVGFLIQNFSFYSAGESLSIKEFIKPLSSVTVAPVVAVNGFMANHSILKTAVKTRAVQNLVGNKQKTIAKICQNVPI